MIISTSDRATKAVLLAGHSAVWSPLEGRTIAASDPDRTPGKDVASSWTTDDDVLLLRGLYRKQVFPRHTHTTFVVGINERSAHSFYCRHSRHTVPPGTIALVNPEEVHTGESVGGALWRYRGIYPTPDWIQRLWQEIVPRSSGIPMFSRSVVHDIELASDLTQAHMLSESGAPRLAVDSAMVDVFARLLLRHSDARQPASPVGRESAGVRRMRELMHANIEKSISLTAIARVAGLSRFEALRAFRRETGITPYQYVTSLRVERARYLILQGDALSLVAVASGFSDQSHLTRRFKRHFGVTPGAFARATRGHRNNVQDERRPRV